MPSPLSLFSKVKLVSITPDAEDQIVYCARVSNPENQNSKGTSEKLIKYLIRHKHWSPFEMANMVVEINTTRAIAQQIIRHRSFSYQEFSQRYSNVQEMGVPMIPHLRRQDKKNRQNSIDDVDLRVIESYSEKIADLFVQAGSLYHEMVEDGIAKECARAILPLATPTRLYMNGTIRSWIHYVQIRSDPSTQLEHRDVALGVLDILKQECPAIAEVAFDEDLVN